MDFNEIFMMHAYPENTQKSLKPDVAIKIQDGGGGHLCLKWTQEVIKPEVESLIQDGGESRLLIFGSVCFR